MESVNRGRLRMFGDLGHLRSSLGRRSHGRRYPGGRLRFGSGRLSGHLRDTQGAGAHLLALSPSPFLLNPLPRFRTCDNNDAVVRGQVLLSRGQNILPGHLVYPFGVLF